MQPMLQALLTNLFNWLAQPSLGKGTLGGWRPGPDTYAWPNDQLKNLDQYTDLYNTYDSTALAMDPINPNIRSVFEAAQNAKKITICTGTNLGPDGCEKL